VALPIFETVEVAQCRFISAVLYHRFIVHFAVRKSCYQKGSQFESFDDRFFHILFYNNTKL
jgi:hypothetical protein